MKSIYPVFVAVLLAGCSSAKKDDPTPVPPTPPVSPSAFKSTTGAFVITPKNGTAYTLTSLEVSFVPYSTYRLYTFRGKTPTGTGVTVEFNTGPVDLTATPTNATVITTYTNATYSAATGSDQSGFGKISASVGVYKATYSAATLTGAL